MTTKLTYWDRSPQESTQSAGDCTSRQRPQRESLWYPSTQRYLQQSLTWHGVSSQVSHTLKRLTQTAPHKLIGQCEFTSPRCPEIGHWEFMYSRCPILGTLWHWTLRICACMVFLGHRVAVNYLCPNWTLSGGKLSVSRSRTPIIYVRMVSTLNSVSS